jgi:uncharacterized delta-60 repeat protein
MYCPIFIKSYSLPAGSMKKIGNPVRVSGEYSMKTKVMSVILSMLLLISCGGSDSNHSGSARGKLDTSFNHPQGFALFNGSTGNTDVGVETAIQPDGKIIIAGYTNDGSKNNVLLLRYTKEGKLDQDFGVNGTVIYDGGGTDHKGLGLALSMDGSIIVAGYIRSEAGRDILILKFAPDGSLVRTCIYSSEGQFTDIAFGVAVQSDGNIVVVGEQSNGKNQDLILLRLNNELSLDPTFGTEGVVTFNGSGNSNDKGFAVIVQRDNKIIVTGAQILNGSEKEDVLVLRYNADGSLDRNFGDNGVFTYSHTGDNSDYGNYVQVQADGKIVVAGAANDGNSFKILLLRLNSHGYLDGGFGTGGVVMYESPHAVYDYALGAAIQADGKILVAGSSSNGSNNDAIVLRFETNGALDPGFAEKGVFTFNGSSNKEDGANAMVLQSDGKIVVVGYSVVDVNNDILTFRLD